MIKISTVGLVTFVSNPIVNGVFRAMFFSTASRRNRRLVNLFVPNIKTIAESAYLGKLIVNIQMFPLVMSIIILQISSERFD